MKFFNAALLSVFMGLFGVFAFFFPVTETTAAMIVKILRTFFGGLCILFWAFTACGFKKVVKNALNVWFFIISACFAMINIVFLIITFI